MAMTSNGFWSSQPLTVARYDSRVPTSSRLQEVWQRRIAEVSLGFWVSNCTIIESQPEFSGIVYDALTPSNSIVELIKHWVVLVAGCIVRPHEWAVMCDDHRDVGKPPLAKLDVSIAWLSISRAWTSRFRGR